MNSKLLILMISLQTQFAMAEIVQGSVAPAPPLGSSNQSNQGTINNQQNNTGYSNAPKQGGYTSYSYGHDYRQNGSMAPLPPVITTFKCEDFLKDKYKFKSDEAFRSCSANMKLSERIDSAKFEKCLVEIPKVFSSPDNDILCAQLQNEMNLFTDAAFTSCLNKSINSSSQFYFVYETIYNLDRNDNRLRRLVDECKSGAKDGAVNTKAEIVNQHYLHTSMIRAKGNNNKFGGLSGAWYDAKENKFFAISDDEREPFISRFTWDVETAGSKPQVIDILNIEKKLDIGGNNSNNFSWGKQFDYEDIVKLNDGNFLTSNEVHGEKAFLQIINSKGQILEKFPHDPILDSTYEVKESEYDCSYYEYPPAPLPPMPPRGSGTAGSVSTKQVTTIGWNKYENKQNQDAGTAATPIYNSNGSSNSGTYNSNGVTNNGGVYTNNSDGWTPPHERNNGSSNGNGSSKGVWVKKTCKSSTTNQIAGVRPNQALEALTYDPASENIFYASEGGLLEDMPKAVNNNNNGGSKSGGGFGAIFSSPDPEFVRMFKQNVKNPQQKSTQKYVLESGKEYGLVAMAALDENRVYTMERAFDSMANTALIRIFLIDFTKVDSKGFLVKEKIADLNQMRGQLNAAFKKLDNFEGMTLVRGRNGQKYLVLVSDNNFSDSQVTGFLLLKLN